MRDISPPPPPPPPAPTTIRPPARLHRTTETWTCGVGVGEGELNHRRNVCTLDIILGQTSCGRFWPFFFFFFSFFFFPARIQFQSNVTITPLDVYIQAQIAVINQFTTRYEVMRSRGSGIELLVARGQKTARAHVLPVCAARASGCGELL